MSEGAIYPGALGDDSAPASNVSRSAPIPQPSVPLRVKGAIALLALFAYIVAIGVYVIHQRESLLHVVGEIDAIHYQHELVTHTARALHHSLNAIEADAAFADNPLIVSGLILDVASLTPVLPELRARLPDSAELIHGVETSLRDLDRQHVGRVPLLALQSAERRLLEYLEAVEHRLATDGEHDARRYRSDSANLTAFVLATNMLGLAIFGVGVTLFFSHLTKDIGTLERRALAIVAGYRGAPLPIGRHDEIGRLTGAVNRMQDELREREQQQELSHQQRFHEERMAAIGSVAAAVAHEVANPINSISGVAQHTLDALRSGGELDLELLASNASLVIVQSDRVAAIVRQIADLAAPHSPEAQLFSLNELVQATMSLIRYDQRFRQIELVTDLRHDVPAAYAVQDHVTQVLVNLLINAADALDRPADTLRRIVVATSGDGGAVRLSVTDNGHGMDRTVLAQAFERGFTTKAAGRGRGVGLYLCRQLVEQAGGHLTLASTVGNGTTATLLLPAHEPVAVVG